MARLEAARSETSIQVSVVDSRQPDVVRALPARLLEVGDEHDLAARAGWRCPGSPGPCAARARSASPRSPAAPRPARPGRRARSAVGSPLDCGARSKRTRARPVLRARARPGARRAASTARAQRSRVAHAVRPVEQHDAHPRPGQGGGGAARAAEERPREGQGQDHEGRAAQREQQPVAEALPPRPTGTGSSAGTSATGRPPSRCAGGW